MPVAIRPNNRRWIDEFGEGSGALSQATSEVEMDPKLEEYLRGLLGRGIDFQEVPLDVANSASNILMPSNSFDVEYENWIVHKIPLGEDNRKPITVGGSQIPRVCRVCEKNSDDGIKFSKKAHILPQGLGNRELISTEECNHCNEHVGSPLEDHLIKFLSPMRSLYPARTRGGRAKHKPKAGKTSSSIESRHASSPPITITSFEDDPNITTKMDAEKNVMHITARTQPVSLMKVAKSLARISYLTLPTEELENYKPIRDWFLDQAEYHPILTEVKISGPGMTKLSLVLCRLRQPLVGRSPLIVSLGFAQSFFFCYLPGHTFSTPTTTLLPTMPLSPYPPHAPSASSWRIVDDEERVLTWHFDMAFRRLNDLTPASQSPPEADPD